MGRENDYRNRASTTAVAQQTVSIGRPMADEFIYVSADYALRIGALTIRFSPHREGISECKSRIRDRFWTGFNETFLKILRYRVLLSYFVA